VIAARIPPVPMTPARRLGIAVNLIGMGFPFLFTQAQPGGGACLAPLWSWPGLLS